MIIVICDEVHKWGHSGLPLEGPFEAEEFMWLAVRRMLCLHPPADHQLTESASLNDIQ
jgi:hypothetical protein